MKPDKKTFAALFALVIAGSLLISGCPGPESDPNVEYPINIDREIEFSNGDITVNRRFASAGETVRITAEPKSGFAAWDVRVRDSLNHSVDFINPNPTNNIYEFKMPPESVTVYARFVDLAEELTILTTDLDRYNPANNSWGSIAEANSLLKQFQQSLGTSASTNRLVKETIELLAGTGEDDGLVREKIRTEKNFLTLSTANKPSWEIDIFDEEDRTHLYYVGLSSPPPLILGEGWTEGTRQSNYTDPPVGKAYGEVTRVPITYQVGLGASNTITYYLLLCPVAQYVLEGTTGSVTITEFYNPVKEPHTNGREQNIPEDENDSRQRTGEVSAIHTGTSVPTSGSYIAVKFEAASGYKIAVKESGATTTVQRICMRSDTCQGTTTTPCAVGNSAGCGRLDGQGSNGFFFPQSKRYIITLTEISPPSP